MHKILSTSLLLASLSLVTPNAGEVFAASIQDPLNHNGHTLVLQGSGVREKLFLDLYVAGLDTLQASHDAQKIIDADEPMAISLHIVSSLISSEKMQNATLEGFEKATNHNTAPLQHAIDAFIAVFNEPITKGDYYELIYTPQKGLEIFKNKEFKRAIEGLEFKKALFGIWLGKEPAQESLKEDLLAL